MREAARLELLGVAQQRSRGPQGRTVPGFDAESVEGGETIGAAQICPRQFGVELPRLALGDRHGLGRRQAEVGRRAPRGHDELRRLEAREGEGEIGGGDGLPDEFAGRQVQGGEARGVAARRASHEEVVALACQPILGEHGSRGDGLYHRAAHESLGELGVLHLLADRDAVPLGDEPAQAHRRAGPRRRRRCCVR